MSTTDKVKELEAQLEEARKGQLFCKYFSPGTLFPETSRYEVETVENLAACAARAKTDINERHGAKPFAFMFTDGNGKGLSGLYFLTGRVFTWDEIPDDGDETNTRLRRNCRRDTPVIVENTNSYRHTTAFEEDAVLVDWEGNVLRRGNDADLVAYRKKFADYNWDEIPY